MSHNLILYRYSRNSQNSIVESLEEESDKDWDPTRKAVNAVISENFSGSVSKHQRNVVQSSKFPAKTYDLEKSGKVCDSNDQSTLKSTTEKVLQESKSQPAIPEMVSKQFKNGDFYVGPMVGGKMHGEKGRLVFANGNSYEGGFENNLMHGYGKEITKTYMYEGDFLHGK